MRDYIGSGHIAAIAGFSPWSNPVRVWRELTDPSYEMPLNNAIKSGMFLESGIAAWWAYENRATIAKAELVRNPYKLFLGATPDFYVVGADGQIESILEVKNTNERNREKWEDNSAPKYYIAQLIWQMHITGIKRGTLCACIGGQELKEIDFEYDAEFGNMLEAAAMHFWFEYVIPRICPPLDLADDETISEMYPEIDKGRELITGVTSEEIKAYKEIETKYHDLKKRVKEFKTRMKALMKGAEFAVTNDLRWKVKRTLVEVDEYVQKEKSYEKITISEIQEKDRRRLAIKKLTKEQ